MPKLTRTAEQCAKIAEMQKMRDDGRTQQEIADKFGLSRQRVNQLIGSRENGDSHYSPMRTYSVYPAINAWFHNQKITISHFIVMMGYAYSPEMHVSVRNWLNGADMRKYQIDRVLAVTGLTYEGAFRKEETN